jgi:hypothetical protein
MDECIASMFWVELYPEDGGDMFLQNNNHQQGVTTQKTTTGNCALCLGSLHELKKSQL